LTWHLPRLEWTARQGLLLCNSDHARSSAPARGVDQGYVSAPLTVAEWVDERGAVPRIPFSRCRISSVDAIGVRRIDVRVQTGGAFLFQISLNVTNDKILRIGIRGQNGAGVRRCKGDRRSYAVCCSPAV